MNTQDYDRLEQKAQKDGARIHFIYYLMVNYFMPLDELVDKDKIRIEKDFDFLTLNNKYEKEEDMNYENIILVNWPDGSKDHISAVRWGLLNDLKTTTPHIILAIGNEYLNLHEETKTSPMYLVETTGCDIGEDLGACWIYYGMDNDFSEPDFQTKFGRSRVWFAFKEAKNQE